MENILEQIEKVGIVPVLKLSDTNKAVPICEALKNGGINVIEVTFRTQNAPSVIKEISTNCKDMLVGAGTILNVEQAKNAIHAGAKFIVCPGYSSEVVKYCQSLNITVIPGCVTPTEIMQAINDGLSVVKFFPAKEFGGLSTIKALSAPFGGIRFMPTGGVNLENLKDFISSKFIVACGGTYMIKDNLIDSENYEEITRLSKLSTELIKEVR